MTTGGKGDPLGVRVVCLKRFSSKIKYVDVRHFFTRSAEVSNLLFSLGSGRVKAMESVIGTFVN